MGKQINQLRSGVILSYINLALGSIIPFVYTPIMLDILGQEEYGLYSLANSVVGYLSLLTFGFGGAIVRYISKYRAEGNRDGVSRIFGFFLLIYSVLGVIAFAVGTVLSFTSDAIFEAGLSAAEIEKIRILVLLMSFNSAISFPLSVVSSVIISYERYVFRRLVDMISTVAAPVANLIMLYLGFASVGMTLATTILQFIMLPLNVIYCFKVIKVTPRFGKVELSLIREIVGFSFFVFLGTLVDMLFWATDKVILGMLAGSVAVAVYNVGGTFNGIVMNLSTSISGVLTPRITGMVVKDASKKELTELFVRVGRLQFLVVALIVSGFTVFGRAFIDLWAGPDYSEAYWIAIMTLFPLCVPLIQNTGLSIVVAQNKHKFRAIVYLVIALMNVVSTYLAVPRFGAMGAALCSCISYILGQCIIMNIYYHKVTGLDVPLFWRNILKLAVIPVLLMGAGIGIGFFVDYAKWYIFIPAVLVYTALYCALMYLVAMNGYEKDVIRKPLGAIVRRIRRK